MRSRSMARYTVSGVLFSALVAFSVPLLAQTSSPQDVSNPQGEAYRLFLLGRHFEREGDLDAAVRAYRDAADLDTETGEILAELSSLYARRNEAGNAVRAAPFRAPFRPLASTAMMYVNGVCTFSTSRLFSDGDVVTSVPVRRRRRVRYMGKRFIFRCRSAVTRADSSD